MVGELTSREFVSSMCMSERGEVFPTELVNPKIGSKSDSAGKSNGVTNDSSSTKTSSSPQSKGQTPNETNTEQTRSGTESQPTNNNSSGTPQKYENTQISSSNPGSVQTSEVHNSPNQQSSGGKSNSGGGSPNNGTQLSDEDQKLLMDFKDHIDEIVIDGNEPEDQGGKSGTPAGQNSSATHNSSPNGSNKGESSTAGPSTESGTGSKHQSHSPLQTPSETPSKQGSTKHSKTNSKTNSAAVSETPSRSGLEYNSSASQFSTGSRKDEGRADTRTTNASRSKSRAQGTNKKRLTALEEWKMIPEDIRNNPYVMKRMGVYTSAKKEKVPRAAMTKQEYRTRELPKIDDYTEQLLKGENPDKDGEPANAEQLQRSASQLRDLQREYTNKGNYVEAKKACNALKAVNNRLFQKTTYEKNKSEIEQLVCKRNELLALVQSTKDDWDQMIEEHDELSKSKIAEIQDKHSTELEEFDKNIPEELPPLFNRYSVTYLQMRSKERNLANNEEFDEAIALQEKADLLEEKEREANFAKMDQYYRLKRRKLKERQRSALEAYEQYAYMRRTEKMSAKEVAIRGQENRIKALEQAILLKCEQKGVKQGDLDLDMVDEERIAMIKQKEDENPVSQKRAASTSLSSRKPQIYTPKRSNRSSSKMSEKSSAKLSPLTPPPEEDAKLNVNMLENTVDDVVGKTDQEAQTGEEEAKQEN